MPRAKPKPQPVQVETPRRGHPALKYRKDLAEAFGIDPNTPDPPRELVTVDSLPDPIEIETTLKPRAPKRAEPLNVDEVVLNILREEMEEIGIRLERFGVKFQPAMKQDMIDHAFALLGGFVQGGGAIASR